MGTKEWKLHMWQKTKIFDVAVLPTRFPDITRDFLLCNPQDINLAASRATLIPDTNYDGDVLDAVNAVSPQVCLFLKDELDMYVDIPFTMHYWCILAQCVSKTPIKHHEMDGVDFELV
eukprot:740615_1